ncbi:MAG: ArgE/DapE family deacylase [Thermoprotei archaeon]
MLKDTPKKLDRALNHLKNSGEQLVSLTAELIRYSTENPPAENYEVLLYIRDFLKRFGLDCELHNPADGAWALTSSHGDGDDGLIFYGHADVVPAGDPSKWVHPPYSGRVVGGRIYGRGASDMKAGLAAELFAYTQLYQDEVELPGKVEFVCVLDEEDWHSTPVGWGMSDWLLTTGKLSGKACVMGEPSGIHKICLGERSDYWVRLCVQGEPRHGSTAVYEDNACVKLFKTIENIHSALAQLIAEPPQDIRGVVYDSPKHIAEDLGDAASNLTYEQLLEFLVKPTLNVGVLRGGTMINIVPPKCEAELAICIPIGMSRERLHEVVSRVVEAQGNTTLELLDEAPVNPSYTKPHSRIARVTQQEAAHTLGQPPQFYVTQATSDANIFRKHGVETVFYGPGEFKEAHSYNESVDISATTHAAQIYLKTAAHYFYT